MVLLAGVVRLAGFMRLGHLLLFLQQPAEQLELGQDEQRHDQENLFDQQLEEDDFGQELDDGGEFEAAVALVRFMLQRLRRVGHRVVMVEVGHAVVVRLARFLFRGTVDRHRRTVHRVRVRMRVLDLLLLRLERILLVRVHVRVAALAVLRLLERRRLLVAAGPCGRKGQ